LFFNLGALNAAKSKYDKIRSYRITRMWWIDLAYDNPAPFNGGGKDITDARYDRIRFQHSFMEVPIMISGRAAMTRASAISRKRSINLTRSTYPTTRT